MERNVERNDFEKWGYGTAATAPPLQGGIIVGASPTISKISKENTCGTQGIHAYGDLAKNDNIRQKISRC